MILSKNLTKLAKQTKVQVAVILTLHRCTKKVI